MLNGTKLLFTVIVFINYGLVTDAFSSCNTDQYECTNGKCIPLEQRCNEAFECSDLSDEVNCPKKIVCPEGLYSCDNGDCVKAGARCDGIQQCKDGSDEDGCSPFGNQIMSYTSILANSHSTIAASIESTPAATHEHPIMYSELTSAPNFTNYQPTSFSNTVSKVQSSTIQVSANESSQFSIFPTSTFTYPLLSSTLYHHGNSIKSSTQSVRFAYNKLSPTSSHSSSEIKSILPTNQIDMYSSMLSPKPTKSFNMTRTLHQVPTLISQTSTGTKSMVISSLVYLQSGVSNSITDNSGIFHTSPISAKSTILSPDMSTYLPHPKGGQTPKEKSNNDEVKIIVATVGSVCLLVIGVGIVIIVRRCRTRSMENIPGTDHELYKMYKPKKEKD